MDLSRYHWRTVLGVATVAMLIQQSFSYLGHIAMPILADSIAKDFDISPAWLGLFLFIQNLMGIFSAIACGGFILRLGALRVSQLVLIMIALSLLLISTGQIWVYPLAAILLGASAASTPASSHILAAVCPPRHAPLIFSIKQTGVPVGSLIGGLLIPFFLGLAFYGDQPGPYGAAFLTALVVLSVAVLLQPFRASFDADRQPRMKITLASFRATLRSVVISPELRRLAFAAFAFGGMQAIFAGFFVLFLIDDLDYSAVEAGSVFATSSFMAVWARILWGWLSGRFIQPGWILACIGLVGGLSALLMTTVTTSSSVAWLTTIAILYNITVVSWHGLLLAETARLAPEGKVGVVTGGMLAFVSSAMLLYPAIYGGLLAMTGSYTIGFMLASLPAFGAFLIFAIPLLKNRAV
ncbi:MAG: MFS transporter [Alphaproteobacteria bacterium]|jgi:MFS family permease|nr:MFS transporter [Alphaproteobacteria bacterium]MBT4086345.1 MFS transporter [Alphaproteobacteria bacterium]MBT4546325.1 MFS transporter [Alphaproteobacteria bacterium]MBT7744163.1 MFS transporter [Alphaproteobacteria bacterium]